MTESTSIPEETLAHAVRARNEKQAQLEALNDRLRLAVQAGHAGIFEMDQLRFELAV